MPVFPSLAALRVRLPLAALMAARPVAFQFRRAGHVLSWVTTVVSNTVMLHSHSVKECDSAVAILQTRTSIAAGKQELDSCLIAF